MNYWLESWSCSQDMRLKKLQQRRGRWQTQTGKTDKNIHTRTVTEPTQTSMWCNVMREDRAFGPWHTRSMTWHWHHITILLVCKHWCAIVTQLCSDPNTHATQNFTYLANRTKDSNGSQNELLLGPSSVSKMSLFWAILHETLWPLSRKPLENSVSQTNTPILHYKNHIFLFVSEMWSGQHEKRQGKWG